MKNITLILSPREANMIADALDEMLSIDLKWPDNEVSDLMDEITKHPDYQEVTP